MAGSVGNKNRECYQARASSREKHTEGTYRSRAMTGSSGYRATLMFSVSVESSLRFLSIQDGTDRTGNEL